MALELVCQPWFYQCSGRWSITFAVNLERTAGISLSGEKICRLCFPIRPGFDTISLPICDQWLPILIARRAS